MFVGHYSNSQVTTFRSDVLKRPGVPVKMTIKLYSESQTQRINFWVGLTGERKLNPVFLFRDDVIDPSRSKLGILLEKSLRLGWFELVVNCAVI